MRQRQRETILEDMKLHKQRKEAEKRAQQEATRRQLEAWAQENEAQTRRDQKARARRQQMEQDIRAHLDRQRQERQAAQTQQPQHQQHQHDEEVAYFLANARRQIDAARQQGKPLHRLVHAVHAQAPPLLSATPNPARRRRKDRIIGGPAAAGGLGKDGAGQVQGQKTLATTTTPKEEAATA